jgi:hypothetical protein
MSRVPHEPTQHSRELVRLHTTVGTTQAHIAQILGIDLKTLRKWYRHDLDLSKARANATIGGALFNKAKGGDTAAMIFWMKTQAGWREKERGEGLDASPPTIVINMPKTDGN